MTALQVWNILGIIAIICLIISLFIGRNAIWGGLTIGIIMCIIVALIVYFKDGAINWIVIKDIFIVFVLLGAFFEIIGRLFNRSRNN